MVVVVREEGKMRMAPCLCRHDGADMLALEEEEVVVWLWRSRRRRRRWL